ncbi:glycosyltransferase family 4 protein [Sphingomonas sp. NFR15]|uniref:glycosyltransferase family 4 protein n=1 Tax=Sphingomonas sp. NFR15 TaxID=1566282 RepID=UPI0015A2A8DC|nr:glycosyltransferase family 4 protein [Sphingomonas sp. NFR15]
MAERSLILAVATYFPDSYGGAERQARILAEALGRKGVAVTLVAPTRSRDVRLEERTEFGRIVRKRVRAWPNLGGRNILSFLAWSMWVPWRLRGPEWRGVPVYVFHARLHALGPALAAWWNAAPLLVKLGGGGDASEFAALRGKKFLYGRLVEWLLRRRVDMFVANSSQIANELREARVAPARIAEFPNGVALPPLDDLHLALAQRDGRGFIYAARLHPDKNVDVLYEAAMALAAAGIDFRLRLVGDGPERDRLAPLASAGSPVTFAGFVADVYPELQASDFFVCASRREGQSNALLEAMSAGVIPIVFRASGVAEVVSHGHNGVIVDEATPAAFAGAMRRALALSPAARRSMSLAARDFAQDNIGIDAIAERTLAAIASVRHGPSAAMSRSARGLLIGEGGV